MALESTIVCAVRNCQNNGQALRAWLGRVCFEHRPNLKADCSCPPLYDFHKLPKDPVDMRMWLKALELTDVPPNCYVCSVHFADKRPSDAHPYPELYLAGRMNPEKGLLAKTNSLTDKKKGKSATIFVDLERRFMETPTNDSGLSEEHKCELCGTCFETRRGLSSHARCHLRQLGVSVSDSSGAPIELLYRLIEERDGQLPKPPPQAKPKRGKEVMRVKKEAQGPALKLKISNLVRKKYSIFSQGASARKSSAPAASATTTTTTSSSSSSSAIAAASSSLSLSPIITVKKPFASSSASSSVISLSPVRVKDSRSNAERSPSASAAPAPAPAKPLWAPQDSDAPLNLMAMDPSGRDDVHVCELCGAWFETRKGLSSHARAHLRTFGIESAEAKGAPIATLQKFMVSKGLKPGSSNITQGEVKKEESAHPISVKRTAPSSPSPKASPKALGSSPSLSAKRLKASSPPEGLSVHDSSIKDDEASAKSDGESGRCVCEFCGEIFVRNQSLSSHARSHLRQLGITEWSVQGSPMATLREVMAQRGVTSILKLPTSTPSQASPSPASLLKIPQPPPSPLTLSSPLKLSNTPSQASPAHKQPKARKGSRFVNKPKDEPMEVDLSEVVAMPGPSRSDTPQSPFRSNFSSPNTQSPGRASKSELDVNQPVECEYCNDTFDSRKALSCHARAHLRHLGVRWPAQASPIDALYQLMQREGTTRAHEVKREPSSSTPPPVDTSAKDATCELCGFDFENRKALASHARAHLRQQGVDWRTNGSPIDTLSAWMLKEPAKVAELHKRYMMGDLPHIRKRNSSSPCPSSDSEAVLASSHRSSAAVRSSLGLPHGSARPSGRKGDRSQGSHSERQSRGSERRPPKHQSYAETRAREPKPSKPSRSGTIPSLVPRPPETPLVRQMGKVYSLKCRFCDKEFRGPLSVQEDWVRHLQEHILNLKRDEASASTPTSPLAPQASAAPALLLTPQPV